MANPKQTSSDLGTLAREIFRMTPAYIFVSALSEALKSRRSRSSTVRGARTAAVAR
jgi:hypothetical protein